jgi:signal transduction histidine kinase
VRVEGEVTALPDGVALSAYRIVQEGLTNVIKHARPASAQVTVGYRQAELEVVVTDDGRRPIYANGGGHGLIGMRERAALYGGELSAGPRPEGGFVVHATLPLHGERE